MNSRTEVILLAVGVVCSAIAAGMPCVVVPQFDVLFRNFGSALPIPTHLMVHYYGLFLLLPPLVLLVWLFWPRRAHRALAACIFGVASLVISAPLVFFTLYLPIFHLAAIS